MIGYKSVFIENKSHLSLDKNRLKIKQGSIHFVPLDDIANIIIDAVQVSMTSGLLSALAKKNIALFSTDDSHIPNGVFLSFGAHSRYTKIANIQIKWSEPFKKRLWQIIIKNKIINQALLLKKLHLKEYVKLEYLANKVRSGDSSFCESQAASIYFKALFGNDFHRNNIDVRNSALNYGYAILRGAISKELVGKGFMPHFGIFHKSELNAFNLSDDIIEPFRVFVDDYVVRNISFSEDFILTKEHKISLVSILQNVCLVGKDTYNIQDAIRYVVRNLQGSSLNNDYKLLGSVYYYDKGDIKC